MAFWTHPGSLVWHFLKTKPFLFFRLLSNLVPQRPTQSVSYSSKFFKHFLSSLGAPMGIWVFWTLPVSLVWHFFQTKPFLVFRRLSNLVPQGVLKGQFDHFHTFYKNFSNILSCPMGIMAFWTHPGSLVWHFLKTKPFLFFRLLSNLVPQRPTQSVSYS